MRRSRSIKKWQKEFPPGNVEVMALSEEVILAHRQGGDGLINSILDGSDARALRCAFHRGRNLPLQESLNRAWPAFAARVPWSGLALEGQLEMAKRFKIGDHVRWNSEAGRVSGTIIAIHTRDFDYKGHVRHASPDNPQYEIKSDKTDHVAAHKGSALEHA